MQKQPKIPQFHAKEHKIGVNRVKIKRRKIYFHCIVAILYSNERYLRAEFIGTIYFNINIPIAEKKPFFYFSYANLTKYIRQNLYALTALHFLFLNPFQCIFSR